MLFTVHNLRASRNEFVIDTVVEIKYLYIAMCLLSNFYPYINQKKCGGQFACLFDNRKMKANKNLSCAGNLFDFFWFSFVYAVAFLGLLFSFLKFLSLKSSTCLCYK